MAEISTVDRGYRKEVWVSSADRGYREGVYHGLKVQGIGELALCDAGTNPLRIRKNGVTYSLKLVDTSDPYASPVRIKTGAGVKAIRKYA